MSRRAGALLLIALTAGTGGSVRAAAAPTPSAAARAIEIDRIEVSGVTVFDGSAIEATLDLTAGDRLERPRVVKSAGNIQALYRVHGYEEVRVKTELLRAPAEGGGTETVLKFSVTEGRPTRIASVRVSGAQGTAEGSSLVSKLGLAQGEIYDQEKTTNGKRSLQDSLAADEYIGARVDEVRVRTAAPPAGGAEAARWVELDFQVELGDRVSFGFRGNSAFTRSRLMSLIEELRLVGFGKDYVGAIREKIEDEYRAAGYARVRVATYTFERPGKQERHVTYVIDEGARIPIESVEFDGNSVFTSDVLKREFYSHASALVQRHTYIEKDVEKAAELVVEWMKTQGYLGARLIAVNRQYSSSGKGIQLVVYVYEGEQTIVQSLRIQGATELGPAEAARILGVSEGAPLNLFAFNEGLEALKSAYRDRGFLDVRVANEGTDSVVRYLQDNRLADLSVEVVEGPRYRVGRIEIEGLDQTKEEVVLRELTFRKDEVLEEFRLGETESRLRRLGIFSSATVRATDDPSLPGRKIVRISVQEGTPGLLAGGIGYRNDLGFRAFGQVGYSNLGGRNHTLSLNANVNRRLYQDFCENGPCFLEYQLQLGYAWPWFLEDETTFRPRVTVEKVRFKKFAAETYGFNGIWERPILRAPSLVGGVGYSLERIRQFYAAAIEDNQTLTIGAITPSLRLDLRDNSLAPTKGFFALTSLEVAMPGFPLFSQANPFPVGYTRFQFRSDYFLPLARGMTWYFSFRAGLERNLEPPPDDDKDNKNYTIPLIKQFAIGGAASLRGYGEQELNLQDFAIRGTASYVNYRTQLDLPFAGPLRFGPFLDAANLLVDRFSFGILRYGAGVGFHYQSPVGPVNFDWGFKLFPHPEDKELHRFYFSIGVI